MLLTFGAFVSVKFSIILFLLSSLKVSLLFFQSYKIKSISFIYSEAAAVLLCKVQFVVSPFGSLALFTPVIFRYVRPCQPTLVTLIVGVNVEFHIPAKLPPKFWKSLFKNIPAPCNETELADNPLIYTPPSDKGTSVIKYKPSGTIALDVISVINSAFVLT